MSPKRIIILSGIILFGAAFVIIGIPMIGYIINEGIKEQKLKDLEEAVLAGEAYPSVYLPPVEKHLPLPDKISATRWIIEDRIINTMAEEVQENPFSIVLYTVYEVEVMKVLKGDVEKKAVSVTILGGGTGLYSINYTDRYNVLPGEHFIMFLSPGGACEEDTISDFGTIAPGAGLYLIEDGIAKSVLEGESLPVDDLREAIDRLAVNPRTRFPGTSGECLYPPPRWSR